MTARYPISTSRGGTDAPKHQQAHFLVKHLRDKRVCLKREYVCVCVCVCVCVRACVCIGVSTPSPLSQHFKRRFSLSPTLHHPGRVHGCQETSGDASAHGPEGLETKSQHHIQQPNMATEEPRSQKKVVKVWRKELLHKCRPVKRGELLTKTSLPSVSHLQQAVAHERHQELVTVPLAHHGGVLRGVHAGEVEHGYVGLAVVVDGKVQCGQLVVGGEVRSLAGIREQGSLVHICPGQQQLRVCVVLQETWEREEIRRGVKMKDNKCGDVGRNVIKQLQLDQSAASNKWSHNATLT